MKNFENINQSHTEEQPCTTESEHTTEQSLIMEQPYIVKQVPPEYKEPKSCMTLRNQFSIMWKLCLIYGICYVLFAYRNYDGIGSGIFAAVSAIFLLMIAKRLKTHPAEEEQHLTIVISAESIFYFIAAVLLSVANCLTDSSFFLFFNHAGSFLLFCIASIKLFYNDKKWDFGKYTAILFSYWIQILAAIPIPFRDFSFYRTKSNKKISSNTRYILIGIVAGLPILLITTMLLASADQIFSDVLDNIFNFDAIGEWLPEDLAQNIILLPCGFIAYTLLLYLVMGALCKGGLKEEIKEIRIFGTPIAITIFIMIDVIYALFCGIQFLFLFAGVPIAQHEYAEYARQGFFELLFVALINFFLVLFCNKHFKKNAVLRIVMTITSLCTFIMIASSAYRMQMYIHAYHLTFLRMFVLWFLLLLTFFMAGSTISIYKDSWNSFRYCLFVLTCFYTVFALSGADSIIAKYNVKQFEKAFVKVLTNANINSDQIINLDNELCRTYGIPYLDNYLPYGYKDSMAYATELSKLREKYGENLGESNINLINKYFTVKNHFFDYDSMGDYTLEKSAYLYDMDLKEPIFTWKHFNFAEYNCYRKCKEITNVTVYGSVEK